MSAPSPALSVSVASSPPVMDSAPTPGAALADLLYDGFYLVLLLRNGKAPHTRAEFATRVIEFLGEFEREAKSRHVELQEIFDAKYALCAMIDETVLASPMSIREEWAPQPLQLALFGDQLAGEHFFDKLESARNGGIRRLASLEVFHLCLLLGFKGKYRLEGSEKLNYLTAQLGDQITHLKGRHRGFAPHWRSPDNIIHTLQRKLPLWMVMSALALSGMLGYLGIKTHGDQLSASAMAPYTKLISYSRKLPHIVITLP